MITIRAVGGLGNQMFQYGAALALARQCGSDVRIDIGEYQIYKTWPFHLDKLCIPASIEALPRPDTKMPMPAQYAAILRRLPQGERVLRRIERHLQRRANIAVYHEPDFHFDPAFFSLKPPITLSGYFQSERYFRGVASEIQTHFTPARPLRANALRIVERIEQASTPISVHVRRGDYVEIPAIARVHGALGADYYGRALRLIEALHGRDVSVFLFSDEPENAARMLDFFPSERLTLVRGDPEYPWEDIALMARCRHHVIANSSFSWWGAWLDPRVDKTVIAPRAWFSEDESRRKNTCDLFPAGWILV